MTIQEFLTKWTIKYVKKNYHNINITYDGAYGFDAKWGRPKAKLSELVKDLKEDFRIVEWFLLEVLWWDETIVTKDTSQDTPISIYNLDGTFIKSTPVSNPNELYYRDWVWEYHTPTLSTIDIYLELQTIGLTHDQCDAVADLINKMLKEKI
jgi:hypothetical protein